MSEKIFTELQPDLYFVHGKMSGRFPYCNGLMIDSEVKVLVDTGYGRSRIERIIESGKVDVIINTHYHMDHVFGNRYFPHAQIWAHTLDAPALRSTEQFMAYTGLNGSLGPDPSLFPGGPVSCEVDKELVNGEVLEFGSISLQVIHAPGHTPGHIALFEQNSGVLFSGDVDLSPFGPWYGNLRSDLEIFIESILRLIDLNPKVLATSHSGIVTDNITERLRDYLAKVELRDEQILHYLRVPQTLEELVNQKIIYHRFPEPQRLYRFFEEVMIRKHLQYLIKQGRVYELNQKFKAFA
ncbi:MBL fold metallo-hydrolase [Desulfosporosinus sp.]|uniref:MBL fold metallo-hydrolase n=1 Tax=Desulfosporosinus sp. TaxID=157907 RepID=UPI0025B95C8F|nr:MBL fold metallo-hydrolase [Desulfosporosinus sp.]MBC2721528.1 MBL fold metallo-hydrolase [Desulfosporosinus sp.]MBC2726652.1 MBL fold metallo-hydrolase [Desulfosporosinus sp.]